MVPSLVEFCAKAMAGSLTFTLLSLAVLSSRPFTQSANVPSPPTDTTLQMIALSALRIEHAHAARLKRQDSREHKDNTDRQKMFFQTAGQSAILQLSRTALLALRQSNKQAVDKRQRFCILQVNRFCEEAGLPVHCLQVILLEQPSGMTASFKNCVKHKDVFASKANSCERQLKSYWPEMQEKVSITRARHSLLCAIKQNLGKRCSYWWNGFTTKNWNLQGLAFEMGSLKPNCHLDGGLIHHGTILISPAFHFSVHSSQFKDRGDLLLVNTLPLEITTCRVDQHQQTSRSVRN